MKIRLAAIADAPRISALLRDLTSKYIARTLSDEGANRLLDSMTEPAIKAYLASGYRYHVAEQDGELAGVVAVRDNGHLYHLFVSERFQRQGVARQLWEVAKDACLQAGNPGAFTVNSSRYAVGLYEKLGFVKRSDASNDGDVISIPMIWSE